MKKTVFALLLAVGLCVPAAQAAERYTLDQLKTLALEANPSLGAARADIDVSRADTITARAYPNPEIEVMGGDRNSRGPSSKMWWWMIRTRRAISGGATGCGSRARGGCCASCRVTPRTRGKARRRCSPRE